MYSEGKICPLLTASGEDGPIYQSCIQGACMFWNRIAANGTTTSGDEEGVGECSINLIAKTNAASVFTTGHIHLAHLHGRKHSPSSENVMSQTGFTVKTSGTNTFNMNPSLPPSTVLIQEFMNNRDEDDNDLVFGYDFSIHNDDGERPPTLAALENHVSWRYPDMKMSWSEYLASMEVDEGE